MSPYLIPPDTRAVGTGNPPVDMDDVADVLTGMGAGYSVLNTAFAGGADPAGSADSTAAINAALAALPSGGGTVLFPAGTYKVSGALNVPTGAVLQGAGADVSIIHQTSVSADTLSATDQRYITVTNLQLTGPSSGSGRGVAFLHSAAAVAGISLTNVIVQDFGGDGVHLETVITSVLANVRSQSNGGHGFFANSGTSLSLKACYANACTGNGYELDGMSYMELDACAADNVAIGYSVNGCSAVVLNACGTEQPVDGFKILGGSANIVLLGCRVLAETGIGFWVANNSMYCFMLGCREQSPGAGATASFQVDSGSAAMVLNPQYTTASNYAAGSVQLFQPTNFTMSSTGSTAARVSRGANTNTGRITLQDAGSDRWAMSLEADTTDNWHLKDLGHTLDALVAVYQAVQPNLALVPGSATPAYGGGVGVVALANASTAPSGTPSGGGVFYASSGHLYWLGATGSAVELDSGGFGTVTSVTAGDTSIVVGGTGAAPTVETGTLDVIAADHPAAGDWSNNSHKITSLANGSASSDAAAFGQVPAADTTAAHILATGVQIAGSQGKWADSGHVHPYKSLLELYIAPTGATGATCERAIVTGSSSASLGSGTVYVRAIGLPSGLAVNNITLFTAAGNIVTQADLSHGWYALLDNTLTVRAVSGDQSNVAFCTAINTGYTLAVSGSSYTTTYSGLYYIAVSVTVSAAAMPQFATSGAVSTGAASAAPVLFGTAGSTGAAPSLATQLASGVVTESASNVFYAYTS